MSEPVTVPVDGTDLPGDLAWPTGAQSVVIFAHGSGSGRFSTRNRAVARTLNEAGFATLLFDLLTEQEGQDRGLVFDIPLLGSRLAQVARWMRREGPSRAGGNPGIGFFGASTGAGAALWAAAEPDLQAAVGAVVSRGGRPDLARARLALVQAPTLLVVGGADQAVLDLNREAAQALTTSWHLAVVPGAGHLFEEPGALDHVATLAIDWFGRHLI
jgi:putative phosphoribosyl transferase